MPPMEFKEPLISSLISYFMGSLDFMQQIAFEVLLDSIRYFAA